MAGIMPLTGGGFFASDLFQHPMLVNGVYLGMALAYATVLLLGQTIESILGGAAAAGDGLTRRYALITSAVGMIGAYALAIRQSATGGGTVTSDLPLAPTPHRVLAAANASTTATGAHAHAASRHGCGTGHLATRNPGAGGSDSGTGRRGGDHGAGRASYPGAGCNGGADGRVTGRRAADEYPHRNGRRGCRGANPSASAADGHDCQRSSGNGATGPGNRRATYSGARYRRTTHPRPANAGAADCRTTHSRSRQRPPRHRRRRLKSVRSPPRRRPGSSSATRTGR